MNNPPRGLIRPAIQATLTALTLALAAHNWLQNRTCPPARRCPNCPHHSPRAVP